LSSGEGDAIRPIFGATLDEWRKCRHDGCGWHARLSAFCWEHGGLMPMPEYRTTDFGTTEWRQGYAGPVVSPLRESA
jgi:hypothetical protein